MSLLTNQVARKTPYSAAARARRWCSGKAALSSGAKSSVCVRISSQRVVTSALAEALRVGSSVFSSGWSLEAAMAETFVPSQSMVMQKTSQEPNSTACTLQGPLSDRVETRRGEGGGSRRLRRRA